MWIREAVLFFLKDGKTSRDQKLNAEAAVGPSAVPWISSFGERVRAGASADVSAALDELKLRKCSPEVNLCVSWTPLPDEPRARRCDGWESAKCTPSCGRAALKQQPVPNGGQFEGVGQAVGFKLLFLNLFLIVNF